MGPSEDQVLTNSQGLLPQEELRGKEAEGTGGQTGPGWVGQAGTRAQVGHPWSGQ